MSVQISAMSRSHIQEAVALQAECFPPPFDPDLLWTSEQLEHHISLFPEGQFVAIFNSKIVGSCSNTLISESRWDAHGSWDETVGGPMLTTFDQNGSTLYGLDISVHPGYRRMGIAAALYNARFELVRKLSLVRYGTTCRLPGFLASGKEHPSDYAESVAQGLTSDATLSPLLRIGLCFRLVISDSMTDVESGNAAALLEWNP